MPDEHKPTPPHRLRGFWILVIVLLAVNWISVLAVPAAVRAAARQGPVQPVLHQRGRGGPGQVDLLQGRLGPGDLHDEAHVPAERLQGHPDHAVLDPGPDVLEQPAADAAAPEQGRAGQRAEPESRDLAARRRSCSGSGRRSCWCCCSCCSRAGRRRAGGGLGGLGDFGRSQARRVDPQQIRVTFDDVAGIDEAKAELTEIVDFLKNPERYSRSAGGCRTACCCTARRERARRCWRGPSPARRTRRSSRSPPRSSSRRSSGSAPRASATCSRRPRRPRRRSSSSTSSTRSAARARGRSASPAPTTSASRRSTRS